MCLCGLVSELVSVKFSALYLVSKLLEKCSISRPLAIIFIILTLQ